MQFSKKAVLIKESSTLSITAKAGTLKSQGIDVISFAVGEPDFDTPKHISESAISAINSGFTKYTPSSGTQELRQAIANKLKADNGLEYDPKQIVVSNGAKHSLTNIFSAIINEGDEIIIPAPYWLSYPQMVIMAGGKPVILKPQKGLKLTVSELEAAVTDKTKALIINSPSNPSGMIYNRTELSAIADFAVKHDIFVISDEIYEKLIYDEDCEHVSIASLGDEIFKRTIVVNGLSKVYAMTGWRIGYTASSPELAEIMSNLQSHATSNPNSIAQKAAYTALTSDQSCVFDMIKEFKKRRDYMCERLNTINDLSFEKPNGAFYLFVNISGLCGKYFGEMQIKDAKSLSEILIEEYQLAAIPCADFGYDDYIRLSYATDMESIKKGMDRLKDLVQKLK